MDIRFKWNVLRAHLRLFTASGSAPITIMSTFRVSITPYVTRDSPCTDTADFRQKDRGSSHFVC